MERIHRNCKELVSTYQLEDVNCTKAISLRKKIFGLLKAAESEDYGCEKSLELFWRSAYYNPISKIREQEDDHCLNYTVEVFIGEIFSFISNPTRNIAHYYIMLGDLMRYVQSIFSSLHYKKAIEANPELGKPFNQLGLEERGIKAIRFYLLSLAAKYPFKASLDNVRKACEEAGRSDAILEHAINITKLMIFNKSQSNLLSELIKLTEFVEDLGEEDGFSKEYLPLITEVLIVAHKISSNCLGDDHFTVPVQSLCDFFTVLLAQTEGDNDSDEDIHAVTRRKNLSSSSENEENDSESEEEQPSTSKIIQIPDLWKVSVCIEWLVYTKSKLATFDRSITPVPASIQDSLNTLTDKLINRLNKLLTVIHFKSEDNSAEEADWLLNGPATNNKSECEEKAKRQLAYWAEKLISCPEMGIEFSKYFRRSKAESSARKNIGMLRLDKIVKKSIADDLLPIFIIFDYAVLEKKLYLIKMILHERKAIPIVPSFVIAELDKMKSAGPHVRNSMRFIEKHQIKGEIRIIKCDSFAECVEELSKNEESAKTTCALLTMQTEKYSDLKVPGLVVYEIEAFEEKMKTMKISAN